MSTPKPTLGKNEFEKQVNAFYKKVEEQYRDLLNTYVKGDSLLFKGAERA